MEKTIITFSANEQKLIKTGGIECYASNIVSYIEAHFDLGANWSGYDSVRAVWSNDNNMSVISTVLDNNGVCVVPFEVLKTKGIVKVNLVGSISVSDVLTDRLTTFPCEAVKVTAKAKIEGSETQPITPSQFEQFVQQVISEVEKVTGMTAQAETLPAGSEATARYEDGILYLGIPQGIQGERGETGADGNGIASVVYNADYSLTLVFDNGEQFRTPPIRGERGPAGADGRDGTDGTDGVTPSLSVGTVTTLPSTEDAYVTRTGTDENPVFDFGIPQGPKGDKGDTGEVSQAEFDEAVSDLKSEINDLGFEEIQTEGDLITAQGLTLTSTMSAMWATNGTIVENSAYEYYQAINQPIKVEAGKTYKFYGIYDANTNGAAILLDANMQNGLRKWGVVSADGGEYTIPDGYSYLCLDVYRAKTLSNIKVIGDVGIGKYMSDNIVLKDDSVEVPMTNFAEYVDDPDWVDTTNMLDDVTWSASGYMRHTNGQLVTSQYTTQYIASDFVPVVSGYKYRATTGDAQGNQLYAVFFSDLKNDGVSQNLGWMNSNEFLDFTVPEGKTYVSFNCVYNGTNKINGLYRRTQLENEKGISIPRLVIGSDSGKPFYGKTIVNFGDSIFGQARPPVDVSTFLAEYTGATVYNAGFGGCQMGYHATANYDAFSMYRLADAIASGDWSTQETAASASGMPSYFADTVTMLEGIDFSEVDIITISYGTNDFENGNALGGNTFSSVDKALDYSISTILTAYPNIRIFVCLPMYRVWLSGGAYSYDSNTATHTSWVDSVTRTFKDFVEAERSVAEANQTPIIDTYYDLGINKYNWTEYFPANDGTHHNLAGRKLIAELMSHKLW